MAPSAAVDELWRQLNNPGAASKRADKLLRGLASGAGMQQGDPQAGSKRCGSMPGAKAVAEVRADKDQQLVCHVRRELNVGRIVSELTDPDQRVRRAALQQTKAALGDSQCAALSDDTGLAKALLRRFADASESCRELAVQAFSLLLERAGDGVLALLPYATPVLDERLTSTSTTGGRAPAEPSEEVRTALVRLVAQLVRAAGGAASAYLPEAVAMAQAGAADTCPDANEAACDLVLAMGDALGMRLHGASKQLVACLLPLATHRRQRVRVAAVRAITPTMHLGAHEMVLDMVAWRDPHSLPIAAFYGDPDLKVNFCGKLAADGAVQVRLAFLAMLADWLTRLPERLDHQPRLLPYVLSALCDDAPAVVAAALQLLDALGAQHEAEHQAELREAVQYLPAEAHGVSWAESAPRAVAYAAPAPGCPPQLEAGAAAGGGEQEAGPAPLQLPGPWPARPRLGVRRLVQEQFGRLVPALAAELGSWQAEPRARAAALLAVCLVPVEDAGQDHAAVLLPALCKALSDAEAGRATADSIATLAAFASPAALLEALLPLAAGQGEGGGACRGSASALAALSHVARGAGPGGALGPHLGSLLDLLEAPRVAGSRDAGVRAGAAQLLAALAGSCPAEQLAPHAARLQALAPTGSRGSQDLGVAAAGSSAGSGQAGSESAALGAQLAATALL